MSRLLYIYIYIEILTYIKSFANKCYICMISSLFCANNTSIFSFLLDQNHHFLEHSHILYYHLSLEDKSLKGSVFNKSRS